MGKLSRFFKNKRLDDRGLTLVEVMISVTIFALMVYPIVTQLNSLLKQNYVAKLSQGETDFATRTMEQFKDKDSDVSDIYTDSSGMPVSGTNSAGYYVEPSLDLKQYRFTKNNIKIEEDLDSSATTLAKRGTTYRVEVVLDSSAYDDTDGTNKDDSDDGGKYQYKNPNDATSYNLENVDDRFAILIKENSGNYDSRASSDLVDKIAARLKATNIRRYNQWLNGVDVLKGDTYKKNTYIKVSYDDAKKAYLATVTISYTDIMYDQTVSYVLMKDKEYDAKALGNRPPTIYFFYNQYVQNNQIIDGSGTDTVTFDNSGLATGGSISENNALKCYLVRSEVQTAGKYVYYERISEGENANEMIGGTQPTQNIAGSYVYKVENNGNVFYQWPSYVVTEEEYEAKNIDDTRNSITEQLGSSPSAIEYVDSNGVRKVSYVYNNVLVPSDYPHAAPASEYYSEKVGNGDYSYLCKKEVPGNLASDPPKAVEGDIVYQNEDRQYVWPNGDTTQHAPDTDHFSICTPSKMDYQSDITVNLLRTADSILQTTGNKDAINIYTNIAKYTSDKTNVSEVIDTGVGTGAGVEDTKVTYDTIPYGKKADDTYYTYIQGLKDDKTTGKRSMYQVVLTLYRVVGTEETKIMTLRSGKEV